MRVTVIGAGIIGCAVAYELARRGAAVTVLDAREPGMGATQASAGILAPHIEAHSEPLLRLTGASLALFDDFVSRVAGEASEAIDYERTGTLQVALDAAEAETLAALAHRLQHRGVRSTSSRGGASAIEPALAPAVCAALLIPDHGYVAVGSLCRALRRAAASRGVLFRRCRAALSSAAGDAPRVCCDEHSLDDADAVVVAAGSWSDQLNAAGATPAVKPIRGQLLRLRASGRPASRVIWGRRCYIVPRRDGSVLVGATVEDVGFDERATAGGVRELLEAALELLPALQAATFEGVRVGLRPKACDELPVIGRSSKYQSLFYATGHYRNGVLLTPLTAALVADLVLEGREAPELADTRPERVGW